MPGTLPMFSILPFIALHKSKSSPCKSHCSIINWLAILIYFASVRERVLYLFISAYNISLSRPISCILFSMVFRKCLLHGSTIPAPQSPCINCVAATFKVLSQPGSKTSLVRERRYLFSFPVSICTCGFCFICLL